MTVDARILQVGDLILDKPSQRTGGLPALVTRVLVDHTRRCSSTRYAYTFYFLNAQGNISSHDVYTLEPNGDERLSWPAKAPCMSRDGTRFLVSTQKLT